MFGFGDVTIMDVRRNAWMIVTMTLTTVSKCMDLVYVTNYGSKEQPHHQQCEDGVEIESTLALGTDSGAPHPGGNCCWNSAEVNSAMLGLAFKARNWPGHEVKRQQQHHQPCGSLILIITACINSGLGTWNCPGYEKKMV
jgi:hypothetical protein